MGILPSCPASMRSKFHSPHLVFIAASKYSLLKAEGGKLLYSGVCLGSCQDRVLCEEQNMSNLSPSFAQEGAQKEEELRHNPD